MKSGAIILGVVVSALLLALAGTLYVLAGNNGEQHYRTSISLVRQIQQISSNWSIEIARVKADPFADFDSLAAFIPRMARLKDELSETAQRIPGLPDRLASSLNAYLNAVEAKEERIERFKSGYAIVRNSTRYLPLATTAVTQQAHEASDENLTRSVATFSRDMTSYLATPTDTARERLTAELQRLREKSVAYPLPLANALANLSAHAEVLLEKQEPTEQLFAEATSSDISDFTDRLADSLEFELGRTEILATYYEVGILGVFGVLTLFWIVLAFQQRSRAATGAPELVRQITPTPRPDLAVPASAADPAPPPSPVAEAPAKDDDAGDALSDVPLLEEPDPEPEPAATVEQDAEVAMMQGFLAECVAESLVSSTSRIAEGMDRLRLAQNRLRTALRDSDLLLELDDDADLDEEMEAASAVSLSVRREANTIADVAKRLAAFSTLPNGETEHGMVDVNACIEEAIATTSAESAVSVARKLGTIPEIFASRTDIRLLVAKIIENSLHALEGLDDRNGTIKIDTARKNDEILVTIIDNGVGITPDKRSKIFRPFYTSREGAMGLGLPLAGHLARKYEGGIKINSLPGQGTVTRITLPTGLPEA